MLSGEYRRSARISELDARKAQQAKTCNGGKATINSGMEQAQGTRKNSNQKLGRKRKTRPVHDLVVNDVEGQVQKAGALSDEDHNTTAVGMSSTIAMPDSKMLGLLLDRLKRRDYYRIFAEPVKREEVEGYYDVIKEPMDFSTITLKLNEGSYKTQKEFEHDIFLVYNNALHFNASNTIYYKQAHAIKELANKLFKTLKNDPKSFETECSMRKVRPGTRTKAVAQSLNSNSCNKTTGGKDERGPENVEVQPRQTYSPCTSFLNENESLLTQVCISSKKLDQVKENKIGYAKSLMQFANNLGSTAQLVAQRKLGGGIAETSNLQNGTLNCHLQAPDNHIPAVASAQENITTAPSLKFPGISAGCQRFSGRKVDNHSTLNGGNASGIDTVDIYDVLREGIAQTTSTMQALDEIRGRIIQSSKNENLAAASARTNITVPRSVKLLGHSAGKELDIENDTLSGQKISIVDSVNKFDFISRQITQASSTNENLVNMRGKMVQTMTNSFDMDTAFKQGISASGHETLNFPAELNSDNNRNKFSFVKTMLDAVMDSPDRTTEAVSSGSKVQELVPARYNSLSSSSWQWPVQTMAGRSSGSQPIGFMNEVGSLNLSVVHQLQPMQHWEFPSSRDSIEQRGQVNWLKLKVEGGLSSTQALGSLQGLDSNYLSGVHQIQTTAGKAGSSHGGDVMPGGQVPNWLRLTGLGSDAAGTSHGSHTNGGQLSNWFKPTELWPQPTPNGWFQKQCRSFVEGDLLRQAEPWQEQGWAMPPNMYAYDKCATSGHGQLRIGAPADNLQKQPLRDSCFPQWAFYP